MNKIRGKLSGASQTDIGLVNIDIATCVYRSRTTTNKDQTELLFAKLDRDSAKRINGTSKAKRKTVLAKTNSGLLCTCG